jgi:glucan phosphorylase
LRWASLRPYVDHPFVPADENQAEREAEAGRRNAVLEGREEALRLKQQYFFVCATLQDILRRMKFPE